MLWFGWSRIHWRSRDGIIQLYSVFYLMKLLSPYKDMLKFVSTSVKTGHGWNHFRSNWRWISTILNTRRLNKVKVVQCSPNWRMLQIKGDREQVLIALRFSHIFAPITAVVNLEFCTNEALDQNLQSLEDSKPGTLGCNKKHFFQKWIGPNPLSISMGVSLKGFKRIFDFNTV